ncbi:MAG TPA: antibiotic biosynthesis monooxygenase [Kineosporiaceae bacterium]|jgi:heme-degrading monooxygenase HmoA|nr:antibiotic biosynthesis monooxygenase [Kineosporiaceae bacterium]
MAYVVINALTVPAGLGETLEQRFAGRAGMVDKAPGFEHFELLRPVEGTDAYLVYTRWQSKADYEAWATSQSFERAHGGKDQGHRHEHEQGHGHGEQTAPPAATASEVWSFEAVQLVDATPDSA